MVNLTHIFHLSLHLSMIPIADHPHWHIKLNPNHLAPLMSAHAMWIKSPWTNLSTMAIHLSALLSLHQARFEDHVPSRFPEWTCKDPRFALPIQGHSNHQCSGCQISWIQYGYFHISWETNKRKLGWWSLPCSFEYRQRNSQANNNHTALNEKNNYCIYSFFF